MSFKENVGKYAASDYFIPKAILHFTVLLDFYRSSYFLFISFALFVLEVFMC